MTFLRAPSADTFFNHCVVRQSRVESAAVPIVVSTETNTKKAYIYQTAKSHILDFSER